MTPTPTTMTEAQIKHMVDRFLMWKLPETFGPDGGIKFERVSNVGTSYEFRREPVGTNLLAATEAAAMVKHMLEGLPPAPPSSNFGLRSHMAYIAAYDMDEIKTRSHEQLLMWADAIIERANRAMLAAASPAPVQEKADV